MCARACALAHKISHEKRKQGQDEKKSVKNNSSPNPAPPSQLLSLYLRQVLLGKSTWRKRKAQL